MAAKLSGGIDCASTLRRPLRSARPKRNARGATVVSTDKCPRSEEVILAGGNDLIGLGVHVRRWPVRRLHTRLNIRPNSKALESLPLREGESLAVTAGWATAGGRRIQRQ